MLLGTAHAVGAGRAFQVGKVPSWVRELAPDTRCAYRNEDAADGLIFLVLDDQTNLRSHAHYLHVVQKVVSQAGVQDGSEITFDFDPSYEHLTIHSITVRRGNRVLNKLNPRTMKVLQRETDLERHVYDGTLEAVAFLEDVRSGDEIEYAYTVDGQNPIFGGKYSRTFLTRWQSYVDRWRQRVLIPGDRTLHYRNFKTDLTPAVSMAGGMKEYLWGGEHSRPLISDGDTPPGYDEYPFIQLSEYASWGDLARWADRLYGGRFAVSPELHARISGWNRQFPDAEERARAALRFVQDDIRYLGMEIAENTHRPTPPSRVFQRRFGDCKDKSLLLCTCLRGLGFTAYPVLVHADYLDAIQTRLPSPGDFNHVIVQASINGNTYWFDPTLAYQRGTLDRATIPPYRRGLVIRESSDSLAVIPCDTLLMPFTEISEYYTVTDFSSPVEFLVISKYRNQDADAVRRALAENSKAETEKNYLNYYAGSYPGIEQAAPVMVTDDETANTLTTQEHYRITDFWDVKSDTARYQAELYPHNIRDLLHTPGTSVRTMPFDVRYPVHMKQQIDVALPEDWNIPASHTSVRDASFSFTHDCSPSIKRFTLTYEYRSLQRDVPPARTAEYIANINAVISQLGITIYKARAASQAVAPPSPASMWEATAFGLAAVALVLVLFLALVLHASEARHAFSIRTVLRSSLRTYRTNLGLSGVAAAALLLLSLLSIPMRAEGLFTYGVYLLLSSILEFAVNLVLIKAALATCSGDRGTLNDFFPSALEYMRYIAASILYAVVIVAGLLLFIVPGIILAVRLQPFGFALVERDLGPVESLRYSFAITRKAEATLIVQTAMIVLILVTGLCLLLLGFLVALPFTLVVQAVAYRRLSDQHEKLLLEAKRTGAAGELMQGEAAG